jgi:hypothetical protein
LHSTPIGKFGLIAFDELGFVIFGFIGVLRKFFAGKDRQREPIGTKADHLFIKYDSLRPIEPVSECGLSTRSLSGRNIRGVSCGPACKRDPVSGVIGVKKGPLILMV